jgi:hypothetical protein
MTRDDVRLLEAVRANMTERQLARWLAQWLVDNVVGDEQSGAAWLNLSRDRTVDLFNVESGSLPI